MKKSLLLAILALSINAFAQSKQPTFNLQHTPLNSMKNVQLWMERTGLKTSDIYSRMSPEQVIKHQPGKVLF